MNEWEISRRVMRYYRAASPDNIGYQSWNARPSTPFPDKVANWQIFANNEEMALESILDLIKAERTRMWYEYLNPTSPNPNNYGKVLLDDISNAGQVFDLKSAVQRRKAEEFLIREIAKAQYGLKHNNDEIDYNPDREHYSLIIRSSVKALKLL